MQKFVVTGGQPLKGEVQIAGAKNAVLKLMAAAALTDEPCVLYNVPRISDVAILRETMSDIGFDVKRTDDDALEIRASSAEWLFVPLEAAMKMRASFILLGPLLSRFGRVIISNPGGDRIGRRCSRVISVAPGCRCFPSGSRSFANRGRSGSLPTPSGVRP